METLEVKNFLNIDDVTLELKRFNIIIGPQAAGKSVLAKLVYFFKEFLAETFYNSVCSGSTKEELIRAGLKLFNEIFPKYVWIDQDFSIRYKTDKFEIHLESDGSDGEKSSLKLEYSKRLADLHRELKVGYVEIKSSDEKYDNIYEAAHKLVYNSLFNPDSGLGCQFPTFIPAKRSFFTDIQQSFFSLSSQNIQLDPMLLKFGKSFEHARSFYHHYEQHQEPTMTALMESIIKGKYFYDNRDAWIISDNRKVKLSDASSGQQSSFAMLLILNSSDSVLSKYNFTIIEEPEAHLFPTAQKQVISTLGMLYNLKPNDGFLLTTHSPYILVAVNNLIMASNAAKEGKPDSLEQIYKIIPKDQHIDFDDVGAWTMDDGKLTDMLDHESKLIDANCIDGVSDEFDREFNDLLDLRYGDA